MRSLFQQKSINNQSKIDRRIITLTTLNTPLLLDPFFAEETMILVSSNANTNQLQLPEIDYERDKNKIIKIINVNNSTNLRIIASANQTFNGSITLIQSSIAQVRIIQAFNNNMWSIT
jgi:hypothetical protein